jgi:hypothetical protein
LIIFRRILKEYSEIESQHTTKLRTLPSDIKPADLISTEIGFASSSISNSMLVNSFKDENLILREQVSTMERSILGIKDQMSLIQNAVGSLQTALQTNKREGKLTQSRLNESVASSYKTPGEAILAAAGMKNSPTESFARNYDSFIVIIA